MKWYIVQVLTGCEEAVKEKVLALASLSEFKEQIGQVVIPSAPTDSGEIEKIYPGYIAIEAEMQGEVKSAILQIPGVSKFPDGARPLKDNEVDKILNIKTVLKTQSGPVFYEGMDIKIVHGQYAGLVGVVDSYNAAEGTLTISVSFFGRKNTISSPISVRDVVVVG